MKKIQIAGLTALTILGSLTAPQAQSAVTDPVGYVTLDIAAGAISNPTNNYLSLSLASEASALSGNITTAGIGTFTLSVANMADNSYSSANGPFYLITEDGDIFDIISNTADTLTVDSSDDLASYSNKSFKIYKHQTINSIFGETPQGVYGSDRASNADRVIIYDFAAGQYESYYYKNMDLGRDTTRGWVHSVTLSPAGNSIIDPDRGFIYERKDTTAFQVSVTGAVINSAIAVPIATGYNFVTVPYPVDKQVTLATSGLYDPLDVDINKYLKGSDRASTADRVLIWNGSTFDSYYYKDEDLGRDLTRGWVNSVSLENADNLTLPSDQAIFIQRRDGLPALNWDFVNILQPN